MNAAPRCRMDLVATALASVEVPGARDPGPLTGSLGVHVPVAIDHPTGAISAVEPRLAGIAGTALYALLIRTSVETSPACWISVTGVFTLRAYPFHRDWTIATIAPTKTILKQTTPATPHSNFQLPRSGDCVRNDR